MSRTHQVANVLTSTNSFAAVSVGDTFNGATGFNDGAYVVSKAADSLSITVSEAASGSGSESFTFVSPSATLIKIGDDSGLTTGTAEYGYKTVVFRPYSGGVPTPDITRWFVFPAAGIEGQLSQSFSLQNQYSYTMTFTAYDPDEVNYKVLRGNTALL